MPRQFSLQQFSHHGFLERLPPDGVTSFKSRGKGAEINIFAIVDATLNMYPEGEPLTWIFSSRHIHKVEPLTWIFSSRHVHKAEPLPMDI